MLYRKLQVGFLSPTNKSSTLTISNVNPSSETTDANLKSYAQGLINLTNNTYVFTKRIDEEKID